MYFYTGACPQWVKLRHPATYPFASALGGKADFLEGGVQRPLIGYSFGEHARPIGQRPSCAEEAGAAREAAHSPALSVGGADRRQRLMHVPFRRGRGPSRVHISGTSACIPDSTVGFLECGATAIHRCLLALPCGRAISSYPHRQGQTRWRSSAESVAPLRCHRHPYHAQRLAKLTSRSPKASLPEFTANTVA